MTMSPRLLRRLLLALALASFGAACGGDDGGSGTGDDLDGDGIPDDEDTDDDGDGIPDDSDDCPLDPSPDCSGDFDDDGIPDDEDPDDDNDGVPDDEDACPFNPNPSCGSTTNEACQHLDIVISVDPSGSMESEKAALAPQVFGGPNGFANSLIDISEGLDDYRVGTIDACPDPAIMHTEGAGGQCNFDSGERWIVGTALRAPGDIVNEFECVGDIWEGDIACNRENDSDEQPALSALASLTPPYSDNENAGFLREDALLVVIAITDEDEELLGTGGGPSTVNGLYNQLTALKGGVNNMVFLGIGATDTCPNGDPFDSDVPATNLRALTDMFIAQERGVWWNLCDGNFGNGLDELLTVIETACNEFEPDVD